jgi:hypothetical protein
MPITIGFFFHGNRLIIFPLFLWEKFVWYKSKDLERIKDVYRGTTVLVFPNLLILQEYVLKYYILRSFGVLNWNVKSREVSTLLVYRTSVIIQNCFSAVFMGTL